MLILEDTRQVENRHKIKHEKFRELGIQWNRTALYCGDYTLPADQSVCIDTKKDIAELIGDIQVKQMAKRDILADISSICIINHINGEIADKIFHVICDDDTDRFPEKEINDICFANHIPEGVISQFQSLYVKRHGFFHRGLKRAQNSGIQLYILVDNKEGVTDIDSLFRWHNPRLDIMVNSSEVIGYTRNHYPRYRKVRKYPHAMAGETLAKACLTMEKRYHVKFLFCKPSESAETILNLLTKKE